MDYSSQMGVRYPITIEPNDIRVGDTLCIEAREKGDIWYLVHFVDAHDDGYTHLRIGVNQRSVWLKNNGDRCRVGRLRPVALSDKQRIAAIKEIVNAEGDVDVVRRIRQILSES